MPAAVTVFVVSVAVCLLAHAAILRSVIRARSAAVDPGVRRPKLLVEIVWALIPAAALAAVLVATWPAVRVNAMRVPSPTATRPR